jgi:hypothetical protein
MLYKIVLHTHSVLRWVVLFGGLGAVALALKGWLGGGEWGKKNRALGGVFIGSVHLQVVLGLVLYSGLSPLMGTIFKDFGGAMKVASLRFWAVEHITMMILAAVVAHAAHVLSKKAEEDADKFKRAALGFGLALFMIAGAIPWPFREAVGRGLFPGG